VGSFAIQLAKAMGAYVFTTCSERNIDLPTSLGADRVIDYQNEDCAAVTEKETDGTPRAAIARTSWTHPQHHCIV